VKNLTKMDKHLHAVDKLGAYSLSSVPIKYTSDRERFFFGGTKFKDSDPWVKVAQGAGWCLFCAISHRTKLAERSAPDGWVTLPRVEAAHFGLSRGVLARAREKCVAAGLLGTKKGKGRTARWKYRFVSPIHRPKVSPAEGPELKE